jgi:P4 family phage/plasmid primase-like protien
VRELRISRGKRRTHPYIRNGKTTWPKLAAKLLDFKRTPETFEAYLAMPPDRQADIKDVGYIVGGPFSGNTRRKSELELRSIVTLDVDHCDKWHMNVLREQFEDFEYVLHSTHKHGPDMPRLRLVFPLSRDVSPEQYEPVARQIADMFGMDYFDDTTFEVSRIMYLPSASSDGEVIAERHEGEWLDPYLDVDPELDFMDWPRSSRVTTLHKPGKEAADPLTRPGWIGAFNRTYDIHAAIAKFDLPFEGSEWDNRYRPLGSTGAPGAIVYDDIFMYSHHETIPDLFNKNVNAFDLVRICTFGDWTKEEIDNEVPVMQRAGMRAMEKLCARHPEVVENSELGDMPDDPEPRAKRGKNAETMMADLVAAAPTGMSECDDWLVSISAYDAHERDMLLKVLQDMYPIKPGIQTLRDRVKQIRLATGGVPIDDELADIERELVDEVLAEHFSGGAHIRRIGKRYWTFNSGCWRMAGDEMVEGKLQKTMVRLREERPEDVAQLVAAIGDAKTSSLVGALSRLLRGKLAEMSETSADPLQLMRRIPEPVVNCLNCELHLDYDGNLTESAHDPEHFYTLQVGTEYDQNARCPEWDRFMQMVTADCIDPEEQVRHIEELGGYIINMSRWLKNWVLFHGPTDTGKSTLLDVFKELLGDSCLAMELGRFGTSGSSFADSMLIGKLLLADDDFDKSAALPDGFIKKVSEEKRITTDIKFGDAVTFQARALPLVCANHWPVTRDVSDAFRERALVFEFTHRIAGEEQDDRRRDLMLLELPGILNRFIDGLVRLRSRGGWSVPIDSAGAHQTWESQSNQAILFMRECLQPGDRVKRADVWSEYKRWSPGKGYPLKQSELYERLDMLLGLSVKHMGYDVWTGWALAPPTELGLVADTDIRDD